MAKSSLWLISSRPTALLGSKCLIVSVQCFYKYIFYKYCVWFITIIPFSLKCFMFPLFGKPLTWICHFYSAVSPVSVLMIVDICFSDSANVLCPHIFTNSFLITYGSTYTKIIIVNLFDDNQEPCAKVVLICPLYLLLFIWVSRNPY